MHAGRYTIDTERERGARQIERGGEANRKREREGERGRL
jgi:hypothetical protein